MRKHSPLLIIVLVAVILRISFLYEIPFRVDGDSSRFAIEGAKTWQEKISIVSTGWYGHTNALFYFIGLFLKIFGENIIGSRLFSASGGILGVAATYFFTKKFLSEKIALYSSFFLSFSFFHLVISRVGTEVSWASFFVPLVLLFLLKEQWWASFLSGVFLAFSQYIYPGARIIPILVVFMSLVLVIFGKRKISKVFIVFLFLGIGFSIFYAPMIKYYFSHPNDYFARINLVSIFQSGWLENELQTRTLTDVILAQIKNSYAVFWVSVKAGAHFWVFQTPYLEKIAMIFFTLGIVRAIISIKKGFQYSFLIFYFFFGVFLAGVLTVNSPTASRYAIIFPAVALLFGTGIDWFVNFFPVKLRRFLIFTILAIFAQEGLSLYWHNETRLAYIFDTNTQIASYAGRYFYRNKGNYQIYFIGNENMNYRAIPSLPFLTKKEGIDIFGPVEQNQLRCLNGCAFVVLPGRQEELLSLKKIFPEGKTQEFKNPLGNLLFFVFEKSSLSDDRKQ